ncbi:oligosaccharide flippase family protein [Flavobacteriales bacterium]|nr:oligosaccharide flippase family protein [Flavobacteriales bacterium]
MKILKSFSIYSITSLLSSGIPFLVLPVLTHYLNPYDYGQLSLFNTYVLILVPIISLGSPGLIGIDFFKGKQIEFSKLFSSVARFIFLNFLCILLLTFFLKDNLESFLELPSKWISIIPFVAFLTIIVERYTTQLINQKKAFLYGGVSVSRVVIEVSLTLLFIIGIGMNWEGRIFSWITTVFLMAIVAIYYFKKEGWLIKNSFDIKLVKKALIYGLPLVPHILGKFVINQSDAIFIAKMISVEDVGIYRIGYQFGFVIAIFSGIFLNIYSPYLHERLAKINYKKKIEIVRVSYVFIFALIALTLLVTFSTNTIFKYLIDEKYSSGAQYVFWISSSYFFWGGYLIFSGYIFHLKKTMILAYLSVLNVALNLILNYLFISKYGVIGAAYATTISFFVVFILCTFISNKLYPMPWLYFLKKNN